MPHHRTTSKTFNRAKDIRHEPTHAEAKLWTYLRSHRIDNVHFRRQHAIGKYIVDFCAPKQKLIIEVDGSQQLGDEIYDRERSDYLQNKGYSVFRFWNHEVMNSLDGVIISIQQALTDIDTLQLVSLESEKSCSDNFEQRNTLEMALVTVFHLIKMMDTSLIQHYMV